MTLPTITMSLCNPPFVTLYLLYILSTEPNDIVEEPTVTHTLHVWTLCPSAASKVQHSTTPGCMNDCRCCWNVTGKKAAFTREGVVVISSFTQLLVCWMSFCRRLTDRLAATTFFHICLSAAQFVSFILCTRTKERGGEKAEQKLHRHKATLIVFHSAIQLFRFFRTSTLWCRSISV